MAVDLYATEETLSIIVKSLFLVEYTGSEFLRNGLSCFRRLLELDARIHLSRNKIKFTVTKHWFYLLMLYL